MTCLGATRRPDRSGSRATQPTRSRDRLLGELAAKDRGQHAADAKQLHFECRLDRRLRSEHRAAAVAAMSAAVDRVLGDPKLRTADLGGPLGCKAFGERAAAALTTV